MMNWIVCVIVAAAAIYNIAVVGSVILGFALGAGAAQLFLNARSEG